MVLDRPFWQACWSSKANATLTLILLALLLPAVWWAADWGIVQADRKSTRLNSSHMSESRMPSSA